MKQMADLLRKGATMLSETCPECNTPLFKLQDGSLVCSMCNKPVLVVPPDADTVAIAQQGSIDQTLMKKIKEVQGMLELETDLSKINVLLETLMKLIDTRQRVRKLG